MDFSHVTYGISIGKNENQCFFNIFSRVFYARERFWTVEHTNEDQNKKDIDRLGQWFILAVRNAIRHLNIQILI